MGGSGVVDGKAKPPEQGSLAGRAIVAVLLLIGYYLLGIVIAAVLIAAPVLEILLINRIHVYLLLLPLVGLSVLWSLVPRRQKWVDPGVRVDAAVQPELAQLVERVAASVGQKAPSEIYLLDEVNAFVTQRGGFLGMGGHRVIGIGVPLMTILDHDELTSVLTHEFGHFAGGDTKLGPLIYRARSAMGRSLSTTRGAVHGLFKAYAAFYLRRTQSISRAQELAADRLAASVTSPTVTANALSRLVVGAPAYDYFWQREYAPVVRSGRVPPYLAGFVATLASSAVADHAKRVNEVALGVDTSSRYDSHPPIPQRIAALGIDPSAIPFRPHPPFPATGILRDLPAVEAALVGRQVAKATVPLAPIAWNQIGTEVLLPAWRADVAAQLAPVAPGLAPVDVPVTADELAALGEHVVRARGRNATRPEREALARLLCQRLLTVSAVERGWTLQSLPGEPVRLVYGDATLEVVDDYGKVLDGELDPQAWKLAVMAAGLAPLTSSGVAGGGAAVAPPAHTAATPPGPGDPAMIDQAVGEWQPELAGATAFAPQPSSPPAADAGAFYDDTPPGQSPFGKKRLTIAGPELRWGDQVVHADQVIELSYSVVQGNFRARFKTRTGEVHFKVNVQGRPPKGLIEAWTAIVRWSERYVEARLVDALVEHMRTMGEIHIGTFSCTPQGFTTRKGTFGWDELVNVGFTGADVVFFKRADNLDGQARIGTVSAKEPGAVLLPTLCQTVLAMR